MIEKSVRTRHKRENRRSRRVKLSKVNIIILLIALIAMMTGAYYYNKFQKISKDPQSQLEQKNSTETKAVIEDLGKILVLPADKQPTVAKVEDVEKLKKSNETFYKDVAPEDYLVLYPDRAIIYRKKENKIINIAPIVDTSQPAAEGDTETTN